ncbi:MAG: PQQ-like beta-propeller repeat protein [Actinobacteria bacterium]|nr:PQQ-like beta-propeller repeat protein [Actinomycetota bacterium]
MSVVLPARASSGASTAADATWGTAPTADGRSQLVWAMQPAGGKAYVGGEFTQLVPPAGDNGPAVTRNHLAAFDIDSHALLPWDPDANGIVRTFALSADGTKLYVGGDFTKIGGVSAAKVAVLDLATGKVIKTFKSLVKGRVFSIALSGNRLFVGGDFTEVGVAGGGTVTRNTVAALDATTGAVLDWTPPPLGPGRYLGHTGTPTPDAPSGYTYAVAVPADGSRIYVGGNFLDLGGQGGMVVLDATTGAALAQQWTVDRPVFDLSVWPGDGTTVFAATGGPGGRVFAFRPSIPSRPFWKASVDGDAVGVAASNTTVFLVGHYDYIVNKKSDCYQYCPDGTPRRHLTAFDAATGAVDPWNPTADTPTGPYSVAVGDDHVFVGGEFTKINGAPQPGFAEFALPPSGPPATGPHPSTSTTTTTSHSSTSSTTVTTAHSSTSSTTATTVKPQTPTSTTTGPPTTTTTRPGGLLGGLFG